MIPSFVICGIEHSGTTVLSDVFRQVPFLDSGFECGVLLCKNPQEFRKKEPFVSNMKSGWRLTDEDLDIICSEDSFPGFYESLKERSGIIEPQCQIFDKTPRYLAHLNSSLEKVDCPFVVTYKDPRAIVYSDYSRSGSADFDEWYESYKNPKIKYMKSLYKNYLDFLSHPRVLAVSLEEMCINTKETLQKIFSHTNVQFKFEYLILRNLRYKHNHASFIDTSAPFKYKINLCKEHKENIESDFSLFEDWFFDK